MKYAAILYDDVIVAKAKNYNDCINDNEIELTEQQYNTISIPCQLIEGVFVPCDFPEINGGGYTDSGVVSTEVITYVGTGKSGKNYPCSVTLAVAPKALIILSRYSPEKTSGAAIISSYTESLINSGSYSNTIILCDTLSTEYLSGHGFSISSTHNINKGYAKKSEDGKTITWYYSDADMPEAQCNVANCTYYILALR